MASQGKLPFQAQEKPMSRKPKKHSQASLKGLNINMGLAESPFQKNTLPSVDRENPRYAKETWGERTETGSQVSDEIVELAEDPFKKFARPSNDRMQPISLKDLWTKDIKVSSEGSNDVMKSIGDSVQKYTRPSDEKAQSGYRRDLSASPYQHRFTLGPDTDLIRGKESIVSPSIPFTSKIKKNSSYKYTPTDDKDSKGSKTFTFQEQHHFALASGSGDMANKESAFSASRFTGSNFSLKMDMPYKRSHAETVDSGSRKVASSNWWAAPSRNSTESQARSSWNFDSMIAEGRPNIMRSIESADPPSNVDNMGDLSFDNRPSIPYFDEPKFPGEEAEQRISPAPVSIHNLRLIPKSTLKNLDEISMTWNGNTIDISDREAYTITDDNDTDVLIQESQKGKKTERRSNKSPIDISDDEGQFRALNTSTPKRNRDEGQFRALNTSTPKRNRDEGPFRALNTSTPKRNRDEFDMDAQTNAGSIKRARQDNKVIDLTEEDIELGIEAALDDADQAAARSTHQKLEVQYRNAPVELPLQEVDTYGHSKGRIQRRWTYELLDGTFLLVRKIVVDLQTDAVVLRGLQLKRVSNLKGYLPCKLNEVVFMLDIDKDDARPAVEQAVIEVSVAEVVKRRHLVITNVPFPAYRFNHDDWNDSTDVAANAKLIARWKFVRVFADARDRMISPGGTKVDQMCQIILENEFEGMISMSNKQLRYDWRGETILGGAYRPTVDPAAESGIYYYRDAELKRDFLPINRRRLLRPSQVNSSENDDGEFEAYNPNLFNDVVSVDLINDDSISAKEFISLDSDDEKMPPKSVISTKTDSTVANEVSRLSSERHQVIIDLSENSQTKVEFEMATPPPKTKRLPGQSYSYADGFCGCGGTTAGAQKAGLRVTIGFDMWDHAGASWKANFPDSTLYLMSAYELFSYVSEHNHNVKIDVLHLSPPCQFFSPAHTIPGQHDVANVAAFLCVDKAVTTFKPRIVTLEETAGLALPYHSNWLRKLINMFTSTGYSVRWKVCELFKWGLCQPRKRLVVIAACPGESMPEFPEYTHDKNGSNNLKPYTTVEDILTSIPEGAEDHNPDTVGMAGPASIPCSLNEMLPRTIVCHGGGNCHPSGRKLTHREYARFQGFSNDHKFRGACVLKQIGNAVPSIIAEVLFNSIRKHLEGEDGVQDERVVIDLDDGPNGDNEVIAISLGEMNRKQGNSTASGESRRSKKADSIITID